MRLAPDQTANPDDEVALLDDLTPPPDSRKSTLSDPDLRLVEALLAVLQARRTDNSIKSIRAQVRNELDRE